MATRPTFTDDEVDFLKTAVETTVSMTDFYSEEETEYLLERLDDLKEGH